MDKECTDEDGEFSSQAAVSRGPCMLIKGAGSLTASSLRKFARYSVKASICHSLFVCLFLLYLDAIQSKDNAYLAYLESFGEPKS